MNPQNENSQIQIDKKSLPLKDMVKIVPDKYIVFQCQDDQPMGQVRITVVSLPNLASDIPELSFELMCTNKQNYRVSNAKGSLKKDSTSQLIRIYIKNIDNLEKCLSDKFRIRIFQSRKPNQPIHLVKLKVLIEKQKQTLKVDDISNNLTQTASRTASLYTNPSLYINPSAVRTTTATDIKSIIYFSRILANQQKKISPTRQREQTLNDFKYQFDESNQKYLNKEKQLKTAENNYQKNKAKQKVCFSLLLFLFIMAIVLGFVAKTLIKSQLWHDISDHVKNQYFS